MRLAIDAWDPSYGTGTEGSALVPSEAAVDVDAEVPLDDWGPRAPAPGAAPWPSVVFVDGVRRVEARAWITDDAGVTRQGICASYAAGAVRSNGVAAVALAEVRRGVFCPAEGADDVVTAHGTFVLRATPDDDPETLSLALQRQMGDLEVAVAQAARAEGGDEGEPVVVDGPLRQHRLLTGAVGLVKTLHRAYGPPVVLDVAGRLDAGQRTPLFVVGEGSGFHRWSWYLRLPGERTHPLAGIVRCEASCDLPVAEAARLADAASLSLPRYASRPHKDSRAPQNLYPVAGLERDLRRRLGDPGLLQRALRRAAAARSEGDASRSA